MERDLNYFKLHLQSEFPRIRGEIKTQQKMEFAFFKELTNINFSEQNQYLIMETGYDNKIIIKGKML